jgi:hypothetical protein
MKYRAQLLEFIDSFEESDDMVDWIVAQPDLEQPVILRELAILFQERYEKTGEHYWLEKKLLVEKNVDDFEESILDDKLAENLLITSANELDIGIEEVKASVLKIRDYIITSVVIEADNKEEMLELAEKLIAFEHINGTYDPDNWHPILPLLNKNK